jgi:hemerythrin-like domain-containing protein
MSSNTIPGFSSPGASVEAPLEMLAACHGRVEKQCETLERLADWLPAHGCDAQAQQAATAVMRYFDTAAPHHHADEEQDLFPALLEAMAGSDAVCIRDLTDALRQQHRELERLWARLRIELAHIAQAQPHAFTADMAAQFVQAYRSHIEREDTELLPMATRLLGDAQIATVGKAMRERRGIQAV